MKTYIKHIYILFLISLTGFQVQAQDYSRPAVECYGGLSVSSYSGNLYADRQDLYIPGRGPELDLKFHYNSGKRNMDVGLGNGWFFGFFWRYSKDSLDNVLLDRPNGRQDYFVEQFGSFPAPPGVYDSLSLFNDTILLKQKDGLRIYFDDPTHRRVTRMVDPNGNQMTFAYSNGLLDSVIDASGRSLLFTWANNHITKIKDPNGAVDRDFLYEYNGDGNLVKVTDPLGQVIEYEYDTYGNLIQMTDKNGNVIQISYTTFLAVDRVVTCFTTHDFSYNAKYNKTYLVETVNGQRQVSNYEFDEDGNLMHEKGNCCGFEATYTYDSDNNITSITDANGGVTSYTYDNRGNRISETTPDGATWLYNYEPVYNRMVSKTDPRGYTTNWTYDAFGNKNQIAYPGNFGEIFVYDGDGNMLSFTDKNGHTTTCTYDVHGYMLSKVDPLGHGEIFTYDLRGNMLTQTDKNGNTTTYVYDLLNRNIQKLLPLGYQNLMTYDGNDNMLSMTDANGHTTAFGYDPLDRVVSIEDALGHVASMKYDERGNMIEYIDMNGNLTRHVFNSRNKLVEKIDPLGHVTSFDYDGLGNRTAETDANGNVTSYSYDGNNRLINTQDALGNTAEVTYDLVGNISAETDKNGNTTSFMYDGLNRLIRVTDALANQMSKTYDGNGNILSETDKNGNTTYYEYDAVNRMVKETNALNHVRRNRFDPNGNKITSINGRGDSVLIAYDSLNRVVQVTDELGNVMTRSYDGVGNRVALTNFRGITTQLTYDAVNRLVANTDAYGNSILYTYDPNGNKLTETDKNGNVSTFAYDAMNRLVTHTDGAGQTVSHTYDGNGNPIQFDAMNGNVITYTYDALNRPVDVRDAKGLMEAYSFDANRNLTGKTNGENETTQYGYDALNRLISETDPLGNVTTYEYDAQGNKIRMIDPLGRQTSYGHDALNRKISTVNALNETVSRVFDENRNLTQYIDARGNINRRTFDAKNQLIRETFPGGEKRDYTYDAEGNRISMLDGRGVTTLFEYDSLNRLSKRDYPTGIDETYTFDANGNTLTATNLAGTITRTYDGDNRMTSESMAGKTLTISHDLINNKRVYTYPSGVQVTEELEERGLIGLLKIFNDTIMNTSFDLANRKTANLLGNGLTTNHAYDGRGNPVSITHSGGVANLGYVYDAFGNRLSEAQNHHPVSSNLYTYDAVYRLQDFREGTLVGQNIPSPTERDQFTYDGAFNLSTLNDNGTTLSFTSNSNNQYTARSGGTPVNYTYDADGNMTGDGNYSFTYNSNYQLTEVDNGLTATYTYDAFGRRATKTVGSTVTQFFYLDKKLIEEFDGTGAHQASYFYGPTMDEPVAMERAGTLYYYHQNEQSSVVAMTDSSGNVIERYSYDGFGKIAIMDASYASRASSAIGNPILYTGQYFDQESGLYYFRARHFHPKLGRFMQRDPLGFNDGPNLYHGHFLPSDTDPLGLAGKFEIELAGFSAYDGLGGGASVAMEIEGVDCCKNKQKIVDGIKKITYKVTAQVGIGVGGSVTIAGESVDLSITGPQYSETMSLMIENKICDGPFDKATICKENAVDMGLQGGAALVAGVTLALTAKGSIKFCSEAWAFGGKLDVSFCGELSMKVDANLGPLKWTVFEVPGLPNGCYSVFTFNW